MHLFLTWTGSSWSSSLLIILFSFCFLLFSASGSLRKSSLVSVVQVLGGKRSSGCITLVMHYTYNFFSPLLVLFIYFLLSKGRLARSSKCWKREEEERDSQLSLEGSDRSDTEGRRERSPGRNETNLLLSLSSRRRWCFNLFRCKETREREREECGVLLMLESFSS